MRLLQKMICLAVVFGIGGTAAAVRVKDITHLKGRRENRLVGFGLVVGLPGTGDGGKYAASIRQLQALLSRFELPIPAAQLVDTKNVAIVMVEAALPENGIREGDQVDVRVSSTGASKSLQGGVLVPTPLQGPGLGKIFAIASGLIEMPDPKGKIKTTGIVKGGALMEADVIHNYVNEHFQVTLILEDDYASFSWASAIADRINEDASEQGRRKEIAQALGPKNVVISIPQEEQGNPARFIADRIEGLELLLPAGEAKVVINRRSGTIVISEDVEIEPVVISHNGMTITTIQPPVQPTPENPQVEEEHATSVEAPKKNPPSTRLQELVDAMNQLNVPATDIIEIVENLHRGGKIRGKLEYVE